MPFSVHPVQHPPRFPRKRARNHACRRMAVGRFRRAACKGCTAWSRQRCRCYSARLMQALWRKQVAQRGDSEKEATRWEGAVHLAPRWAQPKNRNVRVVRINSRVAKARAAANSRFVVGETLHRVERFVDTGA